MKVYSCKGCGADDDFGICLLTVKDAARPPTACPFPSSGDEKAEWELRIAE